MNTMTAEEEQYLEIGSSIPEAVRSQLFGKPCFKIKGKPFICFFENTMIFKLEGSTHQEAMSLDGAQLFDPSKKGRPMKEWVQLDGSYSDKWADFAEAAYSYVLELNK